MGLGKKCMGPGERGGGKVDGRGKSGWGLPRGKGRGERLVGGVPFTLTQGGGAPEAKPREGRHFTLLWTRLLPQEFLTGAPAPST